MNVEESLQKVKQRLKSLENDQRDIPISKKLKKKMKFEELRMKKKNHQPQPFPRDSPNQSIRGKSKKEKLFQSLGIDRSNRLNMTFPGNENGNKTRKTPVNNRYDEDEPGFNRRKRNFERLKRMRGGKKRKSKGAEDGYNFIKI